MPDANSSFLPLARPLSRGRPRAATVVVGARSHWWPRAAAIVVIGYVVASQTLMDIPDWSLLGFALAVLLAALLIHGRVMGVCQFSVGGWFYIPAMFVCYCVWRGLLGSGYGSPVTVLAQMVSAYLGGMGVAAVLRAGVPFRALAYAQVLSSLCQIAAGLLGIGTPDPGGGEGRYAGLTGNANEFGLQLTLGACLIWLLPKQSGFCACVFAVGAVAYGLITSGSRQALLVVLAFVVLVLVAVVSTKKKSRLILVGVIVALCAIGAYIAPPFLEYGGEITAIQRAVEYQEDSSYHKRAAFIGEGLSLWQKAPVFGNGVDAFRELSGEGTYAHNDYVELLCDLGLLGALLFYAIHVNIVLSANRLRWSVRLCCWVLVLLLLCIDTASVGYKRKQTVMILMVMGSLESIVGRRHSAGFKGEWPAGRCAPYPQGSSQSLPQPRGDWHPDPSQQGTAGYS